MSILLVLVIFYVVLLVSMLGYFKYNPVIQKEPVYEASYDRVQRILDLVKVKDNVIEEQAKRIKMLENKLFKTNKELIRTSSLSLQKVKDIV